MGVGGTWPRFQSNSAVLALCLGQLASVFVFGVLVLSRDCS